MRRGFVTGLNIIAIMFSFFVVYFADLSDELGIPSSYAYVWGAFYIPGYNPTLGDLFFASNVLFDLVVASYFTVAIEPLIHRWWTKRNPGKEMTVILPRLGKLFERGRLSQDEFDRAKAKVLRAKDLSEMQFTKGLSRLGKIFERGELTKEEFEQEKNKLLGSTKPAYVDLQFTKELSRLSEMFKKGELTKEEFEQAKSKLLADIH